MGRLAIVTLFVTVGACGGGSGAPAPVSPPPSNVAPSNVAPVADAGLDQNVVERSTTTLNGKDSTDSDGTIVTYLWEQTAGPIVTLTGANAAIASFDTPATTVVEQYTFDLTVTDDLGAAGKDSLQVSVHPNEAPALKLNFPCNGCRIVGNAFSVSGTVSSAAATQLIYKGDDIRITVATTAGSVTVSPDEAGTWVAIDIPVQPSGVFSFDVGANDYLGLADSGSIEVVNMVSFTGGLIELDPVVLGRFYLLEQYHFLERIVEVDQTTNSYRIVYEGSRPGLNDLEQPKNMSLDPQRNRLVVYGRDIDAPINAVDLTTGAVTLLSGTNRGSGVDFINPKLMDIDEDNNRAFIFDDGLNGVVEVDLASGDRSLLTTTNISSPEAMTVDSAGDTLYILSRPLTAIDLNTGAETFVNTISSAQQVSSMDFDVVRSRILRVSRARRFVSALNLASGQDDFLIDYDSPGPAIVNATEGRVDTLGDRYIINDLRDGGSINSGNLIAIDPLTSNKQLWLDNGVGSGPKLYRANSVSYDRATNSVYLLSTQTQSLVKIDLATKTRSTVFDAMTGSGPIFSSVRDHVVSGDEGVAFVIDHDTQTIFSVGLANGNRTIISDASVGTGPDFAEMSAIDFDRQSNTLYVTDTGSDSILTIAVATGDRTKLSDNFNAGDDYRDLSGIDLDLANGRIFVSDSGGGGTTSQVLFSVNAVTGVRQVITRWGMGAGDFDFQARDVQVDGYLNVGFIVGPGILTKVDLGSGDRTILADFETGNGEDNWSLQKVEQASPGKQFQF